MTTPMESEFLRHRARMRILGVSIGALVTGAVCWFVGLDIWHAAIVSAAIVAVGFTWLAIPDRRAQEPLDRFVSREGARHDVLELSWLFRSQRGSIREPGFDRLRALASERLGRRSLTLDAPRDREAIVQLIGSGAYATLQPARRLPGLRRVQACLDALEKLGPDGDTSTTFTMKGTPV